MYVFVCVCSHLLQLSWLTVQSWKEKPSSLSDIIAVHQQTLSMLSMNYGHSHPLHQRGQQQKWSENKKHRTLVNCCLFSLYNLPFILTMLFKY